MAYSKFDLTPDPNVLIALTQTPLRQMDALCELVDNAIDSFSAAKRQGIKIDNPCVNISLPKINEVKSNLGCVRITDNGPGLAPEEAEKALRAGYSSNNQYDNLGLFGMGFNISTGKIGSVTTLTTVREGAPSALRVRIDLNEMNRNKSYQVIPEEIEKPFEHGTVIEITGWWPEGNSNNGFIKTLARYSTTKITEEIGRRYASLIRDGKVQIYVNGIACEAFEFCAWGSNRHVTRKKYGEIPARYDLDRIIFTQRKCAKCGTLLEGFQSSCPTCGCMEVRTIEERIKGWVGIQRYDSPTEYGIDLIRNGRAIRVGEKAAFFEYTDEFNKTTRDYPIDSPFGRIIGEIHLDHVPVDFLKRDFQRSTPEWQRAMSYIRGDSSLQPTQKGADKNESPIFKLYQGYRKVRTAGTADMYMGYWDSSSNPPGPHRISREIEEEFIQRFRKKEPGYFDDAKWWEKVEEADHAPAPEMPTCPNCGMQLLESTEVCDFCGYIIKGKKCIHCGSEIPFSAKSCPTCGKAQEAEILKPWRCEVCGKTNVATIEVCAGCGQPKGTYNTLALDYLKSYSNRDDSLSIDSCTVQFPDGTNSSNIKVNVYKATKPIQPNLSSEPLPMYVYKTEIGAIDVFVDYRHKLFTGYQVVPELLIATEIADRIKVLTGAGHDIEGIEGISTLAWQIMGKYWNSQLESNAETTKLAINDIFAVIKERLSMTIGQEAENYFDELSDDQAKIMATNIINAGEDISEITAMKQNGKYLVYVGNDFILKLFGMNPAMFFDGNVWNEKYLSLDAPSEIKAISQQQTYSKYNMCLEDILMFLKLNISDMLFVRKTMCSVEFLMRKVVSDVY